MIGLIIGGILYVLAAFVVQPLVEDWDRLQQLALFMLLGLTCGFFGMKITGGE